MPKYQITIRATINAKDDAAAQTAARKTEQLLSRNALKTLLGVEGIALDKIAVDPKIARER